MSFALNAPTTQISWVSYIGRFFYRHKIIVLGVLLAFLLFERKTYKSTTHAFLSYNTANARTQVSTYSLPTFINIPTLEIGLPIDETTGSGGLWSANDDSASHLATSPVPGEQGNTVIYAKNTIDAFGKLKDLKNGDIIILNTKDGMMHEYKVTEIKIVSPTDPSLINNTETEMLTLYTPYGFGDFKRFVGRALPLL